MGDKLQLYKYFWYIVHPVYKNDHMAGENRLVNKFSKIF